METEVLREVAIIVLCPERVDVRKEGSHGVGEICVLNCPKEHPTTRAFIVVEFHLCLKAKIKKEGLGEVEDVLRIRPCRDADRDGRVEARNGEFQHTPDIVVPVVRLETDRRQGGIKLRGEIAVDQAWHKLHKGFAHGGVADEAQTRGTKTLKPMGEDDSVKREERNHVGEADLLETVIKLYRVSHPGRLQARKNREGFLDDPINLWAGSVGIAIVPKFHNLPMR